MTEKKQGRRAAAINMARKPRIQLEREYLALQSENERLREWNREITLNARELVAEIERLRIENIQMQAALGYAIMAEDERHILPTNPYKCGTCDASSYLRAENERLLKENFSLSAWQCEFADGKTGLVAHEHGGTYCAMAKENERLRAALREVMDDLTLISKNHWLPVGLLDDVIYVNARAALEGK